MKKILLILIPVFILFSCQKTLDREMVRITQTKLNVGADSAQYYEFGYDALGRIDKVQVGININNGAPGYLATITYNGNHALIQSAPVTNGTTYLNTVIDYTLNAAGLPITRIQLDTFYFNLQGNPGYPGQGPQRVYKADTADYQYDADGLLLKVTGRQRDSSWYNPGFPQTQTDFGLYITDYTNTDRNLTQIRRTASQQTRSINTGGTFLIPLHVVTTDTRNFQYDQPGFNLLDFKNAFILVEYGAILSGDLPLNKAYRNLPGKMVEVSTVMDLQGAVEATNNIEYDFAFGYSPGGFVSSVTRKWSPAFKSYKTYLSYKK